MCFESLTPYDLPGPLAEYQQMLLAVVLVEDLPRRSEGSGVMQRDAPPGFHGRSVPEEHVRHDEPASKAALARERRCVPRRIAVPRTTVLGRRTPSFHILDGGCQSRSSVINKR